MPYCPSPCRTDVDECLVEGTCAHGQCINLDGSFRCSCYRGYEVAPDGKSCQGTEELLVQTQSPLTCHTSIQRFPWALEFLALARS